MKQVKKIIPLIFLAAVAFASCSKSVGESKSIEQIYAEKGLPVRTTTLEASSLASVYATSAVLTGIQESSAHAAVADRVDNILYQVGQRVKKDAIIVTFPTDNPAAQYVQAKVNVEHMRTTLNRMKTLYESGGISRQEFDNVAAQCQVAEANWDAVQQAVNVRAPISGILTRIDVQKSDNVNPGDPLFIVARINQLKAKIWVPENQISAIGTGDHVKADWNGIVIVGNVSQVDISLNEKMQAFGVQVILNNTEHRMRPGINAELEVVSKQTRGILKTARQNLVKAGNEYFAYKLVNDRAVKQPITIGREIELDIEILNGLNAGDVIITEGLSLIEDGQRVRVLN